MEEQAPPGLTRPCVPPRSGALPGSVGPQLLPGPGEAGGHCGGVPQQDAAHVQPVMRLPAALHGLLRRRKPALCAGGDRQRHHAGRRPGVGGGEASRPRPRPRGLQQTPRPELSPLRRCSAPPSLAPMPPWSPLASSVTSFLGLSLGPTPGPRDIWLSLEKKSVQIQEVPVHTGGIWHPELCAHVHTHWFIEHLLMRPSPVQGTS